MGMRDVDLRYLGLYSHLDFWTVWMMTSVSMLEL